MVRGVSNVGRVVEQLNVAAGLTSGPHVPNLRPEHHLTPPINTAVLPLAESVKIVRFSPPYSAPKFILVD
jgi:hypothetical protein